MSGEGYATALFGIVAMLILWIGVQRSFFRFESLPWIVPLRLYHLIGAFGIYFFVSYAGSMLAFVLLRSPFPISYLALTNWLNFGISGGVFLLLYAYLFLLPRSVRCGIWRREAHPMRLDVSAALYTWLLSFPLVLFLSQALELLVSRLFQIPQLPEQIAVKFLKSTFDYPPYFLMATVSIIVLAPLIEELLFRGLLQSYIRQHLGPRQAILITSICFSLFHYSAGQGLGNISIICSLFILALFLGFLYEKQGSLLAPMILHGSFNAISVINLYLFGDLIT